MTAGQHFHFGLRRLRKEAGFTTAAALTLAIGIGACTAMFSIIQAVLLRPFGVDAPDRVVVMWPTRQGVVAEFPFRTRNDMREGMRSFEEVSLVGSVNWSGSLEMPGARPVVLPMAAVSASFFDVLGARALIGRTFKPEDDGFTARRVLVLSHGLWTRQFAADPAIVGRRVRIDSTPLEVVGVMPEEFFFPRGAQYWAPAGPTIAESVRKGGEPLEPVLGGLGVFYALGRLKPDVSIAAAREESDRFVNAIAQDVPLLTGGGIAVTPLVNHIFGSARQALIVLMAAVVVVLLIACSNVAGLIVASGASRTREMAVRAALGASRSTLVGQLLAEGALLAVAGAAIGVACAAMALDGLISLSPADIPRLTETTSDTRVLAFAVVLTAVTTLVLGLVPAWHLCKPSIVDDLKGAASGVAARSSRSTTRRMLVTLQVAGTLVLLTATALCIQSFARLAKLDLGFDPANVLTFSVSNLDDSTFPARAERDAVRERLIARFERDPRVIAAGALSQRPFANGPIGWDTTFHLEGQPETNETYALNPGLNVEAVTPNYFRSMGIRLVRGRVFDDRDTADSQPVVIVSEAMAARVWPGQDPVGKRLRESLYTAASKTEHPPWQTVIGMVATARYREIESPRLDLYVPFRQWESDVKHFTVRTTIAPLAMAGSLGADITAVDSRLAIDGVTTMDEVVRRMRGPWQFNMLVFSLFGVVALALAAIGLFGLVAYAVNQRTREIGVRMALGAGRADVTRLMVLQGLRPTLAGLAIGLGVSLVATRAVTSLLFQTSPTDPAAFVAVFLLLGAVTILASYFPARRAASVDPLIALRDE